MPIPVGGPFHRMGVDVLQLPLTASGNRYVVVFADYLTKWVEGFVVPDQSAETIAPLLVNDVVMEPRSICFSDRGPNFLSELVCRLLNIVEHCGTLSCGKDEQHHHQHTIQSS